MKQSDFFMNITCKKMKVARTKNSKIHWIVFVLLSALYFTFYASASLAADEKNDFDHFNTGFPLSGQHQTVQCATCHLKGIFKGKTKRISIG